MKLGHEIGLKSCIWVLFSIGRFSQAHRISMPYLADPPLQYTDTIVIVLSPVSVRGRNRYDDSMAGMRLLR